MPPRKPAHLRMNRVTKDTPVTKIPAALRAAPPPPPPGLLKRTRDGWARFWQSDVAHLITDADHPALERLFQLRDERDRYAAVARKDRMVPGGATGRAPSVNPAATHVLSLESKITKLEADFGLTPSARLRLGVQFGEARRTLADLNAEAAHDTDTPEADDPRTAFGADSGVA